MPANEGFDSQVASLKLSDIVQNGGGELPPHLLTLLQTSEYESVEELRSDIASADETEREAVWEKSDRCALMRAILPYNNPDGSTSKVGRKVVGWLAHDMKVSGQTVRRYMQLGLHYPPDVTDPETGEVTVVRDPATPMAIYLAGLLALDYGMRPVDAVLMAIQNEWSAGQLRKWLTDQQYREQGEQPPVNRVWFKDQANQTSWDQVIGLLARAQVDAEEQYRALLAKGVVPCYVRVTVSALEPEIIPS